MWTRVPSHKRLCRIGILPFALSVLAVAAEEKLEITDVPSSVSYAKSAPTPGGLTTLFVKGLRGIEGTSVVTQYPAGPELVPRVTVKIYGLPAPVLLVSQLDGYQQINVQVSWKADVTVKPAVEVCQGAEVAVVEAVPEGAFDALFAGEDGAALAFKSSDWSKVTVENPIRRGEYFLLFGANMSPVTPTIGDGELTPDSDPPQIVTSADVYYYAQVSVYGPPPEQRLVRQSASTCSESCVWRMAIGLLGVFIMELKIDNIYPSDHSYEVRAGFIHCVVPGAPVCRKSISRTSKALVLHADTSSEP